MKRSKKLLLFLPYVALSALIVFSVASASTTISTDVITGGNIYATSTLVVTGAITSYSTFTSGGNITVPAAGSLDTATAGALSLGASTANKVVVGSASANVGIASTSPYVALGVTGTTTASAGMVIGAGGSPVTQLLFGTCSVDLPNMTASSTGVANCTATGVTTGDKVFITPANVPDFVLFTGASSTGSNTIQVSAFNVGTQGGSGAAVNPAAATWSWMAIH